MDTLSDSGDSKFFDSTKYLKLEIDNEGRWFQNGAEITHPGIRAYFFEALTKTADGAYLVKIGREVCSVTVHDAPFIVTLVDERPDGLLFIRLNDETMEELKPDSLWIGEHNVPYIMVKNGEFHAKFSRPAYYQLAKWIIFKEDEGKFFLTRADRTYELKINAESRIESP